MLKEYEEEAIRIVEKVYSNLPEISYIYLLRKRVHGLRDIGLEDSLKSITKGLREMEYCYYNNPRTPILLFEKKLITEEEELILPNNVRWMRVSEKKNTIGFFTTANVEVISKHSEYIEDFITGRRDNYSTNGCILIKSKYLKLLADGQAQIKYDEYWLTFGSLDLQIDQFGNIKSNSGKLLYYLINKRRNLEGNSSYSRKVIAEELNLSEKEIDNAIDTIQSAINKKQKETKSPCLVCLVKKRQNRGLSFINRSQNEDEVKASEIFSPQVDT